MNISQSHAEADGNVRAVDGVYQQLRRDIVKGVIRPNEPLVETDLAERLNVSRTPIRESLQQLARDGLIVMRRRRWQVYEHNRREIRELYEIRACEEGFAARLACERASDAEVKEIIAARSFAAEMVDLSERAASNDRFHNIVIRSSGNQKLIEQIENSRLFYFNNIIAMLYTEEELAVSMQEHIEIIDAVERRDADRAEKLAREHVLNAYRVSESRLP